MEATLGARTANLITSFALMAIAMSCMLLQKKRVIAEQKQARRKKIGSVNIGAIFGMDVGGTLTKIVYFEAKRAENGKAESIGTSVTGGEPIAKPTVTQRSSSDSLAQLDCPDHQAALENFYTFMDNNKGAGRSAVVRDEALSLYSKFLDGKLHFLHFETRNMVDAIKYVSSAAPIEDIHSIGCTGGGAHKFAGEFEEELDITFNKFDELECLVRGMHFALNNFQDECFTYRPEEAEEMSPPPVTPKGGSTTSTGGAGGAGGASTGSGSRPSSLRTEPVRADKHSPSPPRARPQGHSVHTISEEAGSTDSAESPPQPSPQPAKSPASKRDSKEYTKRVVLPFSSGSQGSPAFPYLVVNIGSGVSILKVTGPGKAERVSGTSLGGGTYWGLCRLLTNCSTYEEVLDFAERGDANVVDMLVKDIYGGDYGAKLSGSMVASSFGKLVTKEHPREGVREEDLALALLMMITNNIGQVAYLTAQLQKCSKIFFVGNFLRQNPISCRRLAFAISFWSQGKMEAMFLVHEGHFGALGTFLTSAFGEEVDRVININNTKYSDKVAVRVGGRDGLGVGSVSGMGGENRRTRSAGTVQAMIDQRPFPTAADDVSNGIGGINSIGGMGGVNGASEENEDLIYLRNLRGRSFSEDIGRSKHSLPISPNGTGGVGGKRLSGGSSASSGSGSGSGSIHPTLFAEVQDA